MKTDDYDHNVYRIDETDLWDRLMKVKCEMADIKLQTSKQTFKADMQKNRVDAAIVSLKYLEEEYLNFNFAPLADTYCIFPLYEDELIPRFFYFTICKQCEEKQLAVQYIDWLLSNDDARKLVGYGIEGVHYKYDNNEQVIHMDGIENRIHLISIGTGTNMMTKGYSMLGDLGDAMYVKDKLLKSFTPSYNDKRLAQISDTGEYVKAIMAFFNHPDNADKILEENTLSRFPTLDMRGQRSDYLLHSFFDHDISFEFLEELYGKIKEARDPLFIGNMQTITGYH